MMGRPATASLDTPIDMWAEWRDDAACRDHPAPEWFTSDRAAEQRAAIDTCAGCPVRLECLRAALALDPLDDWHVAGGTTRKMRQAFRRGLGFGYGWRFCSVQDCRRRADKARGLCRAHYAADRRGRLGVTRPYVRQEPECSVEGCDLRPKSHGKCESHLARERRIAAGQVPHPEVWLPAERLTRGTPCTVEGCDRRAESRGVCAMHTARERRRRARKVSDVSAGYFTAQCS